MMPSEEHLKYIIWSTINIFDMSNVSKEKIYITTIDFLIKIRNIKLFKSIDSSSNKNKTEIINIPDMNNWYSKINYCTNNSGKIKNINYNEIIKPTKPAVILY